MSLTDEREGGGPRRGAEAVGGGAQDVDVGSQLAMFCAELQSELVAGVAKARFAAGRSQATEGVQDDGDVDQLLQERTPRRREIAGGGDAHGGEGQRHAGDHALGGDTAGAPGDDVGVAETVEAIDGQHHIGGLGRHGGAAGADRHADAGDRQRGGVVDAVADHDGRPAARFRV